MEYRVKSSFRDKNTDKLYQKGDTYSHEDEKRISFLIEKGFLEGTSVDDQEGSIKHTGGGWYELPNGEKIQGKEEALEALAGLEKRGE